MQNVFISSCLLWFIIVLTFWSWFILRPSFLCVEDLYFLISTSWNILSLFSWLLAPAYTIYHRIFTNHWNLSRTFILEFFSVSIKALEYNFLSLNFSSKYSRWLLSYKSGPIMIHGTIDLLEIYSCPGPWYSNFIMSVRIWMIYATNKSGACICITWCFEINIKH